VVNVLTAAPLGRRFQYDPVRQEPVTRRMLSWGARALGAGFALSLACGEAERPAPAPAPLSSGAATPTEAPTPQPPEVSPATVDDLREAILAAAALEPGMVVAEIGANNGWFVDRGAIAIGPSGRLYATDIDPAAIAGLEAQLRHPNPSRSPVELRLCADPRDTGLTDLPADHVDVMFMVDSLCFDAAGQRALDVAYLTEFRRLLRPGGRLLYHMDCGCRISPAAALELFAAAGLVPLEVPVVVPSTPAHCSAPDAAVRHQFVAVLTK
jgi:SAM-dependent methyltransferase